MSRIMINGVGYETYTSEFDVYATIKKNLVSFFEEGSNGKFHFSDGTIGEFFMFTNRKGLKMLRVHGKYVGLTTNLESYLLLRRSDVTRFMNSILK